MRIVPATFWLTGKGIYHYFAFSFYIIKIGTYEEIEYLKQFVFLFPILLTLDV